MATAGAMNSDTSDMIITSIKVEFDMVKPEPPEPLECVVCITRSTDCADISTTTTTFGTPLVAFLGKYTRCDLITESSGQICKTCLNVIAVLEQAELEYFKLKQSFEAIISKNPLFDNRLYQGIPPVKLEFTEIPCERRNDDSEDEPLAVTRKRKVCKTKKKPCVRNKRKPRARKDNIVVNNNKKSTRVAENVNSEGKNVKKEDTQDSMEDCNNTLDDLFKVEMDGFNDNENDSDFFPDDDINGDEEMLIPRRGRPKGSTLNRRKHKTDSKTIYECDQCNAKYTTAKRLELHRDKHLGGKPPYICEVCGASYKHKRACDIHVALHKGISDWKCEECNKLFPSKGALQRHNNIHTGKLNYQCDLCGKSFIHTSSFKMHKLSHSGVKPHACDICGLALMTRSHLKRHKRIHSGEKRHECKICGKRFSERYNLVAHSKSHEAAGEVAAAAAAAATPVPRRRLFRCAFCQDRFERRYMLERHMSTVHGRTLERAPATPRNTMSKLLKAQAQARSGPVPPPPPALTPPALTPAPPAPPAHSAHSDVATATAMSMSRTETKEERSPSPRVSVTPKFQLMSAATIVTSGSWSGAYAAEFGLRHDFPH